MLLGVEEQWLGRGRLSGRRGRGGERRQASHPGGAGERLRPTGLYQLLPQAWTRGAGVEPLGGGLVGISWPSHTDPVKGHVEHDGSAGGGGAQGGWTGMTQLGPHRYPGSGLPDSGMRCGGGTEELASALS